jgi:hypothetical protein
MLASPRADHQYPKWTHHVPRAYPSARLPDCRQQLGGRQRFSHRLSAGRQGRRLDRRGHAIESRLTAGQLKENCGVGVPPSSSRRCSVTVTASSAMARSGRSIVVSGGTNRGASSSPSSRLTIDKSAGMGNPKIGGREPGTDCQPLVCADECRRHAWCAE